MTCFIRDDVTLNPGQIDFGTVRRSDNLPTTALTLTYSGGRPGWEIAEMKTQTAKVKAIAEKVNRPRRTGAVDGVGDASARPSPMVISRTRSRSSPTTRRRKRSRSRSWPIFRVPSR